ncbi:hypothetical protein KP509_22G061100 [Ceratopteris richardii]|uniref:RING-type E3 ubiquitin transferase n=1 Tax=Ceratopteris richardii TaxID=49495 RepID=A0A8T2S8W6_CERRI|nr:hypothetical protein KP509_22G061100 [Ceratopteris richardii]
MLFVVEYVTILASLMRRHKPHRHLIYSSSPASTLPRQNEGLDPAVIAKIPTLIYKTAAVSELAGGNVSGSLTLECVVCLGEFQDNQTLRVLSSRKHTFHIECIDMRLASHSTCPLCRTPLAFLHPSRTSILKCRMYVFQQKLCKQQEQAERLHHLQRNSRTICASNSSELRTRYLRLYGHVTSPLEGRARRRDFPS